MDPLNLNLCSPLPYAGEYVDTNGGLLSPSTFFNGTSPGMDIRQIGHLLLSPDGNSTSIVGLEGYTTQRLWRVWNSLLENTPSDDVRGFMASGLSENELYKQVERMLLQRYPDMAAECAAIKYD